MKKIRVGDVVILKTHRDYGTIGEVIKIDADPEWHCLNGAYVQIDPQNGYWTTENNLEVIDHIETQEEMQLLKLQPHGRVERKQMSLTYKDKGLIREGDVVVMANREGAIGLVTDVHMDSVFPYANVKCSIYDSDGVQLHSVNLDNLEVIDHIDETPFSDDSIIDETPFSDDSISQLNGIVEFAGYTCSFRKIEITEARWCIDFKCNHCNHTRSVSLDEILKEQLKG